MEVIAITDKIQKKQQKGNGPKNKDAGKGGFTIGEAVKKRSPQEQHELQFEIGEIEKAIYAKLVQKVGNRHHWEDWANDIAKIARTHIDRITGIIESPDNTKEREAFHAFAHELRDDLNGSITDGEIIEMLAQHLITKPVFDALFADYSFAKHNPMSIAMQGVLDVLQEHRLDKETDTLEKFYESVKLRAEGIDNAAGKQKIVVELYDKFFRNAFPKMTERLGIVYTPVEVVDFIIHSVAHILEAEFGQTLGSKGVHIIDPFVGTGTFVTRLLQSGLMKPEELPHKYKHEIHANEIVLLAYYIAAINIEAVYHGIVGGNYQPFEGICLTDTFQMYETEDMVDALLVENSARRKRQKKLDIRVIIGNPPYASAQDHANDNNQSVSYLGLDEKISETYIKKSARVTGKSKSYDAYIRAIRWASDRIGNSGVIGYVTNAGWLDSNSADGLRKCLVEEFSSLYVFHLRGNARTAGEQRRKERDNVFGVGSRAPIAISVLVKNPNAKQRGQAHFHDIGDYLSITEKLEKISNLASIDGISKSTGWQTIFPDQHGDWFGQRDSSFADFMALGDKSASKGNSIFNSYSIGILSNRDVWVFNYSRSRMCAFLESMINFYNSEVIRMKGFGPEEVKLRLSRDKAKIKWTSDIEGHAAKGRLHKFHRNELVVSLYRPFSKTWNYSSSVWNWSKHLMPSFFPDSDAINLVICVTGTGTSKEFSALMTNFLPEKQLLANGQCFPLYLYEKADLGAVSSGSESQDDLFSKRDTETSGGLSALTRKDGISDVGLKYFQSAYQGEKIGKDDVFYYVYGLLHSPDYRERYADNLSKELPRMPCIKTAADFWAFSKAGRKLADLHVNYETVEKYPLQMEAGELMLTDTDYRVETMRYGKNGKDKDLTTLIYNDKITLTGIPLEAYEYVVNGKPALDWVVERQCVKTDKDSGIVNDANDWATETMNNPRYPLELFQRVVTVSLETMKIVKSLPRLDVQTPGPSVGQLIASKDTQDTLTA
jgi:predicted helicase